MDIVYSILLLMGGLGAFLMGANMLSDNLGKLANGSIKKIFNRTSKNKLVGVGVGAATTAVVQSSSLTTVMVVGLVNAGIMSLYQATTVIMGANIGTTITAHLAALQAFDFDSIAISLTCVGAFMAMLSKKDKVKTIGQSLAGLGLIFVGLLVMKNSMAEFKESDVITTTLESITNPVLLLFLGVAFTAIVQSSSAITSILITMATEGLIVGGGGNAVLFVILGSNIGTCATAILSTIGANRNAKRASLIHLMFNVFGSLIFFILLVSWDSFMESTFEVLFAHTGTQIAMFHTFFNVVCTILFLPFTSVFVKIANTIIKDKSEVNEDKTYLDKRFLSTPGIAIEALLRETVMLIDVSMASVNVSLQGFINKDEAKSEEVAALIEKVSRISKNMSNYLVETSFQQATLEDERAISALHHNNGDIVRISELADNITKYTHRSVKDDLVFSEGVYVELNNMYGILSNLAEATKDVVLTKDVNKIKLVDELEEKVDAMRKELVNGHIERMNAGVCRPASSNVFINLVNNLERIGDHLTFVAHSID